MGLMQKNAGRVISVLAGISMLACSLQPMPAAAAEKQDTFGLHWELEEAGRFERGTGDLWAIGGLAGLRVDRGEYWLIGPDGEAMLDREISRVDELGDGLYAVRGMEETINDYALIDSEGKLLIPFEAAAIKRLNERYLQVFYAEGESSSEAVGAFDTYDRNTDRVKFDGYFTVYDLQKGRMVEDVKSSREGYDSIYGMGNAVVLRDAYDYYCILDENGTELEAFEKNVTVVGSYLAHYDSQASATDVYDDTGAKVFSIAKDGQRSTYSRLGDSHLYASLRDGGYEVVDMEGNSTVIPDASYVRSFDDCLMVVETEEKNSFLSDYEGNKILDITDAKYMPDRIADGAGLITREDDSIVFFNAAGAVSGELEKTQNSYAYSGTMEDGAGNYYVFNDGDYTFVTEDGRVDTLGFGLVGARTGRSKNMGIYDLFTGEELVSPQFVTFLKTNEYVYGYTGSEWISYRKTLEYDDDYRAFLDGKSGKAAGAETASAEGEKTSPEEKKEASAEEADESPAEETEQAPSSAEKEESGTDQDRIRAMIQSLQEGPGAAALTSEQEKLLEEARTSGEETEASSSAAAAETEEERILRIAKEAEKYEKSVSEIDRINLRTGAVELELDDGSKVELVINVPLLAALGERVSATAKDLEATLESLEISGEIPVLINGIVAKLRVFNPFDSIISAAEAIICSVKIDSSSGDISFNGNRIGETTHDEVLQKYRFLYDDRENEIVYKVQAPDFVEMIGEENAKVLQESMQVAPSDEAELVFSFDADKILSSVEYRIPSYYDRGLGDNIKEVGGTALDAEEARNAVDARDRVVDALKEDFAESGNSELINANSGKIQMDSNILFAFDSYELSREGKAYLDRVFPGYLGVILREEYKDVISGIDISGYADTRGTFEYNQVLSERRAQAVLDYILSSEAMGLDAAGKERIREITSVVGHSEQDPVYGSDGEIDMDLSRRVEIRFLIQVKQSEN